MKYNTNLYKKLLKHNSIFGDIFKILKSYLAYAHDNESKEYLCGYADQFEEYACGSLKCCYNFDEEKACEIAIRRIHLFGSVTCLQVTF